MDSLLFVFISAFLRVVLPPIAGQLLLLALSIPMLSPPLSYSIGENLLGAGVLAMVAVLRRNSARPT